MTLIKMKRYDVSILKLFLSKPQVDSYSLERINTS